MFNLARQWSKTWVEAKTKNTWLERIRSFTGQVYFHIENEDFIVTVARHGHELLRILELRHEVFIEEWQGRSAGHGLDIDDFDLVADHLMIIDKKIHEVVGTYRLLSSNSVSEFYSQSEFHIDPFLALPGLKLELGRACIHAEYRDGRTIDLLWSGLAKYIEMVRAQYLFGCASVKSVDAQIIADLYQYINANQEWSDDFNVRPTYNYQLPRYNMALGQSNPMTRQLIPALLRSYLAGGAKIYGQPALDRQFNCVDVFTILELKNLKDRYRRRYFTSVESGYFDLRRATKDIL